MLLHVSMYCHLILCMFFVSFFFVLSSSCRNHVLFRQTLVWSCLDWTFGPELPSLFDIPDPHPEHGRSNISTANANARY